MHPVAALTLFAILHLHVRAKAADVDDYLKSEPEAPETAVDRSPPSRSPIPAPLRPRALPSHRRPRRAAARRARAGGEAGRAPGPAAVAGLTMHACPRCSKPTDGSVSDGGRHCALCAPCVAGILDLEARGWLHHPAESVRAHYDGADQLDGADSPLPQGEEWGE